MHPDDVDVAGAQGEALVEDLRALVDQRVEAARHDLVVADRAARDAALRRYAGDQLVDGRIRKRDAAPLFVAVPAGAGLLPEAAPLAEAVGDRRVAQVGRPGRRLRLPHPPAHVETGEIRHLVRSHRQAEVVDDAVDLLRQRPFLQQEVRLPAVGVEHPVADEAVADADQHAHLAERLRQPHDGGDGPGRGAGAAHVLHQLHDVGGAEEVGADDLLRPRRGGGDGVDVEGRRVGGQDRLRLAHAVEAGEDLLLERQLLEHRLDHDVGRAQVRVVEGRRDAGQPRIHLRLRQPPLRHGGRVVPADDGHAAVERLLRRFENRDRQARGGDAHRDAAAHRAAADHPRRGDRPGRRLPGHVRDLRYLALGEEGVALRRRLVRLAEPVEDRPLVLQRLGVGHRQRRLHAVDAGVRRVEAAGAAGHLLAEVLEDLRPPARRLQVLLQPGRAPQRRPAGREAPRPRHRRPLQVSRDAFVGEAEGHRLLHRVELPPDDHVQRRLDADEPRQALRAPRAGQDAEGHFRQAEPRAGGGEPHVARQRHLHAAARRDAVDGGDHRLRRRLDLVQDRGQGRGAGRRRRAELPDVRPAAEHPARAGDDDRRDGVVGQRLGHPRPQRGPHGEAQAVDGGVRQTEQRHVAVAFEIDGTGHA